MSTAFDRNEKIVLCEDNDDGEEGERKNDDEVYVGKYSVDRDL